jgi:proteasome lid subunit RPN8/RPN11
MALTSDPQTNQRVDQPASLTVIIPAPVYDAILAHAREGKPEEICGVMRGRGLEAFEAIRGRNLAADKIENYEVDPQTLLMQFQFEDAGEEMMGIYHSHPVSVAYPSATDAWNAFYPDAIYFILSLEVDAAPVLRAFRLTPHFVDVDSKRLRSALSFYETRPGLFAYYQPAGAAIPTVLHELAAQARPPFYVVYSTVGESPEARVVSVEEYRVAIHP